MKGTILTNGIIRADDGNRYSFELSDVENLGGLEDLSELEVDFEPQDKSAKSICLLNQKGKIISKCEEIKSFGKLHIFRGIANFQKEGNMGGFNLSSISKTGGASALLTGASFAFGDRHIKMGNEYFRILGIKAIDGIIEDGDELIVCGRKFRGAWISENYGNISKNYIKVENIAITIFSWFILFIICIGVLTAIHQGIGILHIPFIVLMLWLLKRIMNRAKAINCIKKLYKNKT